MTAIDKTHETEELAGEELVDAANAAQVADRALAEADRLWASTASGWRVLSESPSVRNETIPLRGAFAGAGVDLERATATIDGPAQLVFDLLVSPQGTRLIDPYTDPSDRGLLLETFDVAAWRPDTAPDKGSRLEAIRNYASVPLMAQREFIALNIIEANARYFIQKSILHAAAPGASEWGPNEAQKQQPWSTVRAVCTFAVRVESVSEATCKVHFLNHANLAGNFSALIQRTFNRSFLPAVTERLQKAVAEKLQAPAS
jgi:hypothetical protein